MCAVPGASRSVPQRTCIGCHEVAGKRGLLRVVRVSDGSVEVDPTGKKSGRGAYLHLDVECLEKALKGQRFSKALRIKVDGETIEVLRREIMHAINRADLLSRTGPGSEASPGGW